MYLNLPTLKVFTNNYRITLTLLRGWWGRCTKNYLLKEEGKEGGEKKHAQRTHGGRGLNPGPATC